MNLVSGDWIPVLYADGASTRIGLKKLFADAESITDLAVNPPQRIALMRMLICIAQAALDGPADPEEWKHCKPAIPIAALDYLSKHNHEFELYGEKPFMQVPTLKHTRNAVLDKLDFGLAAGNNATLFDHAAAKAGRHHDDGWVALMLTTYLAFSPGGLVGTTEWNGTVTTKTSEHAPCVESSYLHTYIRAANLIDTIHLNLISKAKIDAVANLAWGRPTWELDTTSRANEELQASVMTYLGRLLPLSRAIRLERNRTTCTLANGLAYPKFPECREPAATVVVRRDGELAYVQTSLDKHPWRELNAVLSLGTTKGGAWGLENLMHARNCDSVEIWTGGLAADKGKILDMAEWAFTIPLDMIGNDGPLTRYEEGVKTAESAERQLYGAVKTYSDALKLESTPMPNARVVFWSALDASYTTLIDTVTASEMPLERTWLPVVQQAAYTAYTQSCPHTTPRQIQAFAKGKKHLKLKKTQS